MAIINRLKQPCSTLLGLLLWAALEPAQAQFVLQTNANDTLVIAGYTGGGGNVSIPASIGSMAVTEIGTNAFAGSDVASVLIPTGLLRIDDFAFSQCSELTNVTLPLTVTDIGSGAFEACDNLAGITIPNGVTNIADFAFNYCGGLRTLTIPGSVVSIGQAAFQTCARLTNLTLLPGVANLGNDAFFGCSSLLYVGIPGSVTHIGQSVFQDCANLETAYIASGVPVIGTEMFASCPNLRAVFMPASVTNIGPYAFAGANLTTVTLPANVTGIGDGAFSGTRLTDVTIPTRVTGIGPNAFCICPVLTNITVAASNLFYSSIQGVLFDASQSTLVQYPAGLGVLGIYTVPGSVTNIGAGAFAGCHLAWINLPTSVRHIGEGAFYQCVSLGLIFCAGNAPATDASAFDPTSKADLYYLPGTTGWSSPFAGLTALPWNPTIQASGPAFGVKGNQFGFDIAGTANILLIVQSCTNLANPTWQPVEIVILRNGPYHFNAPWQTNIPSSFYRLIPP